MELVTRIKFEVTDKEVVGAFEGDEAAEVAVRRSGRGKELRRVSFLRGVEDLIIIVGSAHREAE